MNLQSERARKARLYGTFSSVLSPILYMLFALLLICGVGLLVLSSGIGYFLIGIAAVPLMYALWITYDLRDIPAGGSNGIDDVLESNILAKILKQPSPKTIAESLLASNSARFIITRFELSHKVICDFSSDNTADSEEVWQQAELYRTQAGSSIMRGDMLVAALCVTQPSIRQFLPHLQLEEVDLASGVRWFGRIEQLYSEVNKPHTTGGIARDWNFGYANLLERFGVNISQQVSHGGLLHADIESHKRVVSQLQAVFSGDGRQNVALVGKLGSGKSSVAQVFAGSLMSGGNTVPSALRFRQVVRLDAGALIRFARNRNELESIVQRLFMEAFQAKNIILFLDDAQLFFEEGNGSVDITSALLPIIEGGRLRIFMAMDEQSYLRIAQRSPAFANGLNRINIAPANEGDTMLVMQDQIIQLEGGHHVTYSYQALKAAYRLSERYLYDTAQPGRALRLLELAARQADSGFVTAESVAAAVEQASGVKVAAPANDTAERDMLLNLEALIHKRMVNQSRAVTVVSDALRRARAGVRNEKRPIGTFLFLGPTGVGKTELAKALAAVYFGGEDHLVRLDLNEYVRSEDVMRLIADGANDPHGLTASVLKQPFSVVLLDEIEKAHPQVLTTLLQMLDEGILRDANNREVSFRDTIVIATSNAGEQRIRQLINQGQQLEEFEGDIINDLIDSQQFRPEFLNRFDEIIVFRPLTADELVQVIERMIGDVNVTLNAQKIQVTLTPEAKKRLVAVGYDPRLGARPMRRVIQRNVENLVAKRILDGTLLPGQTLSITDEDIQIEH